MSEIIIVPTGNASSVTVNETGKDAVEITVVTAVVLQETDLSPYYSKEETNALLDDKANLSNINTETTARQNADDILQQNIDNEATARTNADTTLQALLDAETATRANNDDTLLTTISAEATSRTSADTTLQNNINAEASARTSADTTLQNNIDGKVDKITGKGLSTEDYTTTEKTKLAGITDGATANNADAYLLNRSNHTGIQDATTIIGTKTSSFISDFADTVRSTVLTGIDLTVNAIISATDSVLSALGKLQKQITDHKNDTSNPHAVTKSQVELSNADNTSDANKPVSTAQQTALDLKLDKAGDTLTGIAGAGFIGLPAQSSNPSAPVNGIKLFTSSTGDLSAKNSANTVLTYSRSPDIQIFTTVGANTWTKPPGAKIVYVYMVGAGAGGGSGRKGAAGTVRTGGGAGGAGSISDASFNADALPFSVIVTVPVGGVGGASRVTNSTNGIAGGNSGYGSFGGYLKTTLSFGGGAGSTTAALAGTGATGNRTGNNPNNGNSSSGTGGAASVAAAAWYSPTAGNAGGGITSANVPNAGGASSANIQWSSQSILSQGAAGTVNNSGGNGSSDTVTYMATGGGGGGASIIGNAGAGGNGGLYGGGGGGGGAALDSVGDSGKGGDGAQGIIIVYTYF